MPHNKAIDLLILSKVYDECHTPNNVTTLFSDNFKNFNEFKNVGIVLLLTQVKFLTSEGFLDCTILYDESPMVDNPKLHDFNIRKLTRKGLAFLSEYRDSLKR